MTQRFLDGDKLESCYAPATSSSFNR